MSTTEPVRTRVSTTERGRSRGFTETKPFFLTSEFLTLVAGVAGVLIAAAMADNLQAPRAWLFVTILGAAYILSRGLAKHEHPHHDPLD